jgi:hypothetical protein
MMKFLERQVKYIYPEKRAERQAHAGEFQAIEEKYGFPPLKHFLMMAGPDEMGTEVLEREWPSIAAWEATIEKINADPDYQALTKKYSEWARYTRLETYMVLP